MSLRESLEGVQFMRVSPLLLLKTHTPNCPAERGVFEPYKSKFVIDFFLKIIVFATIE